MSLRSPLGHPESVMILVGDELEISRTSLELTKSLFPNFLSELKYQGWTTSHALLGADEWRARWGNMDKLA